jgi:uncharacterized 2Fe-2S/4Fe-4S cluster protein (DUF4445 family)
MAAQGHTQSALRRIEVSPEDFSADLQGDRCLLDLIREAGGKPDSPCNGMGTCGKCRVRILSGETNAPGARERSFLTAEELQAGVRLACYTYPESKTRLEFLDTQEHGHKIQSDGIRLDEALLGGITFVEKRVLQVDKPTLTDNRADMTRIEAAAGLAFSPLFLPGSIADLPQTLRDGDGIVTAIVSQNTILAVEPGDTSARLFGAAVDIGTTTVVVSLIDLNDNAEIGSAAAANEQRAYGQDVLSRIRFTTEDPGNGEKLQRLIAEQIEDLIAEAAEKAGVRPQEIYAVSIAANTSMQHLLLQVDGDAFTKAPYQPAFVSLPPISAKSAGLKTYAHAILQIVPSVSAYVGGDITAGVLATGMDKSEEKIMLIDIGTNGEIIFGNQDGFLACSCAAGPALEGMNIACGVIAAEGAIESVAIENGTVRIETIGGGTANGICGSGIVDAVAALLDNGVVLPAGRFAKPEAFRSEAQLIPLADRFQTEDGKRFVLTHDRNGDEIYISQGDVRQVQLAKAAIASALEVLMREMDIRSEDIDKVYIAGGFGRHLKLENLIRIGLIPEAFRDKVRFVGNTAKSGAEWTLLSADALYTANEICAKTKYFELSVYEGYEEYFVRATAFPK